MWRTLRNNATTWASQVVARVVLTLSLSDTCIVHWSGNGPQSAAEAYATAEVFVEELRELVAIAEADAALALVPVQNAAAPSELDLLLHQVESPAAVKLIDFIRTGVTGGTAERIAVVKEVPYACYALLHGCLLDETASHGGIPNHQAILKGP